MAQYVTEPSGAQLVVPAGALEKPETLRLAKNSTGAPPLPQGWKAVGPTYEATPHGTQFAVPVTVRLPVPAIVLEPNEMLGIAKAQPGGEWELQQTVQEGAELVTQVDSLSYFEPVVVGFLLPLQQLAPIQATVTVTCNGQPCVQPISGSPSLRFTITTNGGQTPEGCAQPRLRFFRYHPNERFIDGGGWALTSGTPGVFTASDIKPTDGLYADVYRWNWAASVACGTSGPRYGLGPIELNYAAPVVTPLQFSIQSMTCNGIACASPLSGPQSISLTYQGNGGTRPKCSDGRLPVVEVWGDRGYRSNVLSSFTLSSDEATSRAYTVQDTVQPNQYPAGNYTRKATYYARLACSGVYAQYPGAILYWEAAPSPYAPAITSQPRSVIVTAGQTASFTAVVFQTPGLQWQSRAPGGDWADIPGATSATYTTPPLDLGDTGTQYRLVAANTYGVTISQAVTASVTTEPVAPYISTQPVGLTVLAGSEAVFAVVARGTEALSYQWYRNGTEITGANAPIYKLGPVSNAEAGSYTVRISNALGAVTSSAAVLTVTEGAPPTSAPTIATQPASLTVSTGNSATFAVGVSGSGPFTYQWYFGSSEIPGATAAAYTLSSVVLGDAGQYSVRVSNSAGSVTSTAATLTVTNTAPVVTAPAITTHPATLVVPAGASATLAVAVSGTSPFTYQWFRNGAAVAGATGAVLTLTNITALEAGSYLVTVTNGAGSATSNAADVIVLGVPVITGQPAPQTVADGGAATFSVVATGNALRYQWQRNGQGIPGAESASYTTPAVSLADSGSVYSVIVFNQAGLVISTAADLTVTPVPPTITSQPAGTTVTAGQTATFSVGATGSGTLAYQWRRNGADIAGATAAVYTTPATIASDSGAQFTVVVSSPHGSVTSATATLTVSSPPLAGTWGAAQLLESGTHLATESSGAISRETGDGVVVWKQSPDGIVGGIYASRYDADTDSWSGPTLLGSTASAQETVYYPKAAINSTGDIVVAWMQNTNQSTGNLGTIRATRFTPGAGWSEVYVLTRLPGGPEPTITWTEDVDVDMDFAGHATVVWAEQYRDIGVTLMSAARMPAGGSFQTAELLESSQTTNKAEWTRVVMDSAGNAIATWQRRKADFSSRQVVARRRPANGTWGAEVVIADVPDAARLGNPDIAVNPATGDALVAWRQRSSTSGSLYDLRYSRYLAATDQWTPAAAAETDTVNNVGWVSVAVNKLGQGVIAWERYQTSTDVRATRVDVAGGVLGSEIAVAGGADLPSAGIDMDGNVMVIYKQSDGFRPRATARRLPVSGSPESSVILSSPSIYAEYVEVDVADDGRAIASWMEGNYSGGLYTSGDIYGRVFR